MVKLFPFCSLRPARGEEQRVACLPYDVLDASAVKDYASDPHSFVHVIRSEADLPDHTDPYSEEVYAKASKNLKRMTEEGILTEEDHPCFYLYRETNSTHTQTGFVGTVLSSDYEKGIIRRHELTVSEKEDDRTSHILACNAQTGPVFLTYKPEPDSRKLMDEITAKEPVYDFVNDDVRHQLWVIDDEAMMNRISAVFETMPLLYIADGHHRAASSYRVAKARNASDQDEAGRFMAVAFPSDDLYLLGYHRFVLDRNGRCEPELLNAIGEWFDIEPTQKDMPNEKHTLIMVINGNRYLLTVKAKALEGRDTIGMLDASLLQNLVLGPILGIDDPRRNKRITFIGGKQGEREVEAMSVSHPQGVGFLLYPTDINDLIAVADEEGIMPPKSTWFEPKLLSGLFIHRID